MWKRHKHIQYMRIVSQTVGRGREEKNGCFVVRRLQSKIKLGLILMHKTLMTSCGNQDWRVTWVNKHLVPSRSIHPSIHLGLTQDQHSGTHAPAHPWDPDAFQSQMISDQFLVSTLQEVFTVVKTWQESINTYTNTTWLSPPLGCALKTALLKAQPAPQMSCRGQTEDKKWRWTNQQWDHRGLYVWGLAAAPP